MLTQADVRNATHLGFVVVVVFSFLLLLRFKLLPNKMQGLMEWHCSISQKSWAKCKWNTSPLKHGSPMFWKQQELCAFQKDCLQGHDKFSKSQQGHCSGTSNCKGSFSNMSPCPTYRGINRCESRVLQSCWPLHVQNQVCIVI